MNDFPECPLRFHGRCLLAGACGFDCPAVSKLETPDLSKFQMVIHDPEGMSDRIRAPQSRLQEVEEGWGVGSQLWRLLSALGIEHSQDCRCLDWAERMNAWGPEGCRLARDEIVQHMRASAKSYGWGNLAKAVTKAITTGLAFRLSVTDPYGSLVDEAIRMAEQSGPPGPGGSGESGPLGTGSSGVTVHARAGRATFEPIDVLLPLGPGSHWDNVELRMAIRSIERHAQGLRRIVVVGAIPQWLRETDRVLPVKRPEFKCNKASRISLKVQWAFEHLDLTDTVAFWNDDYILTRDVDIRTIRDYYHGSLRHPNAKTGWQRLLEHTASCLAAAGLPTRHYDIHVPILYERAKFLAINDWWERSRREPPGLVAKSVYGNNHCHATAVRSPDAKLGANWRGRIDNVTRLWVFSYGDEALRTGLADWLQQRFPEVSPSEAQPQSGRRRPPAVQSPAASQTIVCVLGPFRSGTSAVAGLLHRLGVPMGSGWITRRANPGGTYEDQQLGDLCRAWFRERRMVCRAGTAKRRAGLRRWARTRPPLAGAKHPSLCFCVPQIVRAWPGVKFVAVDRPAAESVASLVKIGWSQDNAAAAVSRLLESRDRDLAACTRPVIWIAYHELLRDPAAAVDQLVNFLELQPTEQQRRDAIQWIDPAQQTVRAA